MLPPESPWPEPALTSRSTRIGCFEGAEAGGGIAGAGGFAGLKYTPDHPTVKVPGGPLRKRRDITKACEPHHKQAVMGQIPAAAGESAQFSPNGGSFSSPTCLLS